MSEHPMRKLASWLRVLLCAALIGLCALAPASARERGFDRAESAAATADTIAAADLPREAREVLARIHAGGPFAYEKDGSVFGNYEKRLPGRKRGYYREYTVKTGASRDRGAIRIIAGASGEYWYTDNHYRTFRLIAESGRSLKGSP